MKGVLGALALLAAVHGLALAGLGGYAWQQGWLSPDRVRAAAQVLMTGVPAQEAASAASTGPAEAPPLAKSAETLIRRDEETEEQYRIELARRDREIRDAYALLETKWLDVVRQQEALEAERRRFDAEQERVALEAGNSGRQAEIDTLSSVDAKTALALLRQKSDADAVRILMEFDERKRAKVVKECKTEEERRWIGRILEQFHEESVATAEDLDAP